jgi:hypothetical protein
MEEAGILEKISRSGFCYPALNQVEFMGDLSDGLAIPMRPANGTVIVHRKHFLNLRAGEWFRDGTFTIHGCARVGPF